MKTNHLFEKYSDEVKGYKEEINNQMDPEFVHKKIGFDVSI
ncbi:hypothetical protein ACF7HK_04805 [Staphylococcus aureus]